MTQAFDWPRFHRTPIVGILRGVVPEDMPAIGRTAIAAGLTTLEITLNSPRALESIRLLQDHFGGELNIGAGTVITSADAVLAVNAGARFLVTPVTIPAVLATANALGVPVFPGALSVMEVLAASQAGAAIVKLFPASGFGPPYLRELKACVPQIGLLPTGGITRENMLEYRDAGACGFGIGSPLFPKHLLQARQWAALEQHLKGFTDRLGNAAF